MHLFYVGMTLKTPSLYNLRLLHPQQLTNSHFHFLIIVESATSQVLLQQPKQYSGWSISSQWTTTTLMFEACCVASQCHP